MRRDRYDGFREFVVGRSPALSRAAYLLTGDHQLAEDLLQSALAKVAGRWAQIRDGNPEGYVRRVLYTEFVSSWRRRRLVEHPSDSLPEQPGQTEVAELTVRRLMLERALRQLAPRQRAVLVLRYFEDQTEAQAAEILGISVGTVKRQAHDALERLRRLAPELSDLLITASKGAGS